MGYGFLAIELVLSHVVTGKNEEPQPYGDDRVSGQPGQELELFHLQVSPIATSMPVPQR